MKILKRILAAVAVTGLLLSLVSCGSKLDPAFDEGELNTAAEQILTDMNDGNFEAVQEMCSDELADKLTPEVLQSPWDDLNAKLGAYDSVSSTKIIPNEDGSATVILIGKYEKSKIQLTITFNQEMELIGLYMK